MLDSTGSTSYRAIKLLKEKDIRKCVGLSPQSLEAVEAAFTHMANGRATVPPIMAIEIPERKGEVDVKSAYIRGLESFAIKVASGFFENPRLGLPSSSGMMLLMSAETGFPQAILMDNGYLTDVRTAMAGAIAAKYLARKRIDTVGVIGAGTQARYQVRALRLVRDFRKLMVFSRTPDSVERYAAEMADALGAEVVRAPSAEAVVRGADVVVTTTPSRQAYVKPQWLHPGLHVTAMGSDGEMKQELEAEAVARAGLLACDLKSQCFRLGELHHAFAAGHISEDREILELGELTSGSKPGRQSEEQISICDLTGVGVQDTAIALLAYREAQARRLGVTIES